MLGKEGRREPKSVFSRRDRIQLRGHDPLMTIDTHKHTAALSNAYTVTYLMAGSKGHMTTM